MLEIIRIISSKNVHIVHSIRIFFEVVFFSGRIFIDSQPYSKKNDDTTSVFVWSISGLYLATKSGKNTTDDLNTGCLVIVVLS